MKELAGVVLATALLLALSMLAIERGDRETFVSPPDAVAEGFAREVVTKRWDCARTYLADPDSMSNAEIAALQKSWTQRLGDPSQVNAETISRTGQKALVNVSLKSANGSEVVAVALVFDGDWKIARDVPAELNGSHLAPLEQTTVGRWSVRSPCFATRC